MDNTFLILLLGGAILLAGLTMLAIISRRVVRPQLDIDTYESHFQTARGHLSEGNAGRQLAVVHADKLLDRAMKELGFKGDTMGVRLKLSRSRFSDINGIWEAHKLRNRIAHETDVSISHEQAERALEQLRRGLKDLGALR